jgi:uncharacterized protein with HEPN domain
MKDKYPSIDWPAIAASGNVYRHEYEAIAESLIWHTIQNGLRPRRDAAVAELDLLAGK